MENIPQDISVEQPLNIEKSRADRNIEAFVSDYAMDDKSMRYVDREIYFEAIKKNGWNSVRAEIRMEDLMDKDGDINQEALRRYKDSLQAMKVAGIENINLAIFTPSQEMYRVAKTDTSKFEELYKKAWNKQSFYVNRPVYLQNGSR